VEHRSVTLEKKEKKQRYVALRKKGHRTREQSAGDLSERTWVIQSRRRVGKPKENFSGRSTGEGL